MVRINIIIPESKREKFFQHCRQLKPRKSMNAALNDLIGAVLDGKISLPSLEGKPGRPTKGK